MNMKSNINKVTFGDIKGNHPLLKKQIEIAVKASRCDAPVLIYGKRCFYRCCRKQRPVSTGRWRDRAS